MNNETDHDIKDREAIEKSVDSLCDCLNNFNPNESARLFYFSLIRQHRTIQQSFWRMIFKLIHLYCCALFDGRNEASVKACEVLSEFITNDKLNNFIIPMV